MSEDTIIYTMLNPYNILSFIPNCFEHNKDLWTAYAMSMNYAKL